MLEHGAVIGNAGEGRVASAARADYAAAAAAVLTGEGHENKAYELSGDTAWSFPEYAAVVAELTGREVAYQRRHRARSARRSCSAPGCRRTSPRSWSTWTRRSAAACWPAPAATCPG